MSSAEEARQPDFALGSIVELRSRLWRVDDLQRDVLVATSIDGTPVERRKFYLPFELVRPGGLNLLRVKLWVIILLRICFCGLIG